MTTPTPGQPLGMSDFFALEAGEYLERLDALVQPAEGLGESAEEFVRLARALRGAALMGNQPAIARSASGLETLARAVKEGRRPWDQNIRQIAIRTVDDLKIFVRRAASWTEADTAKAEALGAQLEELAAGPSSRVRAVEPPGVDAGARAFVAREGAAIAGALERAAQALRANPLAHDPLQHVLKALQPLRGLAALNDLPPLPDLLEGIERVIADLARASAPAPTNVGELFSAAGSGTLAEAVGGLARRAREAVAKGGAVRAPAAFAAGLRRGGDLLAQSASGDEAQLAGQLDKITATLAGVAGGAAPTVAPDVAAPIGPIQSLAPTPAATPHHAPRTDSPAPRTADVEDVPETPDIIGSWVAYHRMVMAGVGPASLAELLAGATRVPPPAPSRHTAARAARGVPSVTSCRARA